MQFMKYLEQEVQIAPDTIPNYCPEFLETVPVLALIVVKKMQEVLAVLNLISGTQSTTTVSFLVVV